MNLRRWKWHILYANRYASFALLLTLLHQSLVAGSTFFLTGIIERFQAGLAFTLPLCLYLLSMALPYLPGAASFYAVQHWINTAHARFTARMVKAALHNVQRHRNTALRDRMEAILARNAYPLLQDYITSIHDLASFALNSMLSMLVIGLLLPSHLLAGYLISLALCVAIILMLRRKIAGTATASEIAYAVFSSTLGRCWDNLTLGNRHNQRMWRQQADDCGNRFYAASCRRECWQQTGNVMLAAASLGPTIYLIFRLAHDQAVAKEVVAAIIVSLTRIFLVLNSLSALVHKVLDFSSMQSRLLVLFQTEAALHAEHTLQRGTLHAIFLDGRPVHDPEQALQTILNAGHGRFRLTGANGTGKSTLLLALQQRLGDDSFYLPANHANLTWRSKHAQLSTGQQTVALITEITQLDDIAFLLLDEWDANLDRHNTRHVDRELDAFSQRRVVVEVRHATSGSSQEQP